MNRLHSQINTIRFLIACSLTAWSTASLNAGNPDPTMPSPQIVKRLSQGSKPTAPPQPKDSEPQKDTRPPFQLKAIVLRDNNNGTALISDGGPKAIVIRLRRAELHANVERFAIAGLQYEVRDFSRAAVILFCLDTKQHFIVN